MRKLALSGFALLAVAFPLLAASGRWGERGISYRFAISGNHLYAADGRGVSVYDISNPASPVRTSVAESDDETADVALMGTTELVVAVSRGVQRYRVESDGSLTLLGTSEETPRVSRVAASSDYVAAIVGTKLRILRRHGDDLMTINEIGYGRAITAIAFVGPYLYESVDGRAVFVLDPATGAEVARLATNVNDFALGDGVLWGAGAGLNGLIAIDVTHPASPTILSRTLTSEVEVDHVAASGTRVFAVTQPDTVRVFDAADPKAPHLLSTFNDWVSVIAASGSSVFVSGQLIDFVGLPAETGVPLRVYDVSDPAAAKIAGEVRDYSGPVTGVWTDGSVAWVIDRPYLRVIDVSKTEQPREIAAIRVPFDQEKIEVKNGMAIVWGRGYVNLIDVSDPYHPKVAGLWWTQGHVPSGAAFARDTFVEANRYSGVHVVDYSDPAHAVQITGHKSDFIDAAAANDVVYAQGAGNGILVMDISNRYHAVDSEILPGFHQQLETAPQNSGEPQYLVARGGGISVYDLVDPLHPQLTAIVPFTDPELIGIGGTTAYIAARNRLSTLDLTHPSAGVTQTDMVVTSPMQISVAGDKIVIADRYQLRVYGPDTAPPVPPASPRHVRSVRH